MKIYVIETVSPFGEDRHIEGVYSSEKRANAIADEINKELDEEMGEYWPMDRAYVYCYNLIEGDE